MTSSVVSRPGRWLDRGPRFPKYFLICLVIGLSVDLVLYHRMFSQSFGLGLVTVIPKSVIDALISAALFLLLERIFTWDPTSSGRHYDKGKNGAE